MAEAPRCFISYSWDTPAHQAWVRLLATRLRDNGVDAILDQFQLAPGADVLRFMETAVRESDFVLLICTPTFAQKANAGQGGVGYEKAIVSGEIFSGASDRKFIPILRIGEARQALPSYLTSRLYVDFRDDSQFEQKLDELLRHCHGEPLYRPPPLGRKPAFKSDGDAASRPAATAPSKTSDQTPLFFEGFDDVFDDANAMQERYGKLWQIGQDGPWEGSVAEGRHLLVNQSNASAVQYFHINISDADNRRMPLERARTTVMVSVDPKIGAPMSGAGLLYRFDAKRGFYLGFLLMYWGSDETRRPFLAWAQRDQSAFSVRHSEVCDWLKPGEPVLLSACGREAGVELTANSRLFKTIQAPDLSEGDPGILAVGLGRFAFDNFTIWPPN